LEPIDEGGLKFGMGSIRLKIYPEHDKSAALPVRSIGKMIAEKEDRIGYWKSSSADTGDELKMGVSIQSVRETPRANPESP
jgi:hypothetical protein